MFNLFQNWLARKQIKAIKMLKEQNAFDENGKPIFDRYYYHQWQQLTGEYIQHFVGKDSIFYKDFIGIKLLQVPIETKPSEMELVLEQWELQRANTTLMNCIIYISKFKYLYRKPSLFGLLPVTGQISIAIFGATMLFYIGRFTVPDKPTFESEFKECKHRVDRLTQERDSLLIRLSNVSTNENPENKPDK